VKPHKRFIPASLVQEAEAPGQLGGSGDLEEDIRLCPLQTIDAAFRRHLPPKGMILEAGAGRGRWVFHLRRLGFDVHGIELAASDASFAKRFDPQVPIIVGNVLYTPYGDGEFDAVISLGVLEHFEEGPGQALEEVRRILVPGGLLLVTVPTRNLFRILLIDRMKNLQTLARRFLRVPLAFEEYRYSRRQFSRCLTEAGFMILETMPDDFRPPKNMGLYTDSRLFRSDNGRWELNLFGNALRKLLNALSPWASCSGTLWVCCLSGGERR